MNKNEIPKKAEEAAKKICSRGCCAGYTSCEKPQHKIGVDGFKIANVPLIGEDNGCPLAKYDVPDTVIKPFFERLKDPDFKSMEPTSEDCFNICANCENGVLVNTKEGWIVDRPKYMAVCLDCPNHMAEEQISEGEAEGRIG